MNRPARDPHRTRAASPASPVERDPRGPEKGGGDGAARGSEPGARGGPENDILGRLGRALDRSGEPPAHRLTTDPDTVERDLVKLVLTIVELVRQLMERQALRRVDQGDLTEDQEERIGLTLMLLEDRMSELRERYGLTEADLNLDLGPLGTLLPTEGAD